MQRSWELHPVHTALAALVVLTPLLGAAGALAASPGAGTSPDDFGRWETSLRDCRWDVRGPGVAAPPPQARRSAAKVLQEARERRPASSTASPTASHPAEAPPSGELAEPALPPLPPLPSLRAEPTAPLAGPTAERLGGIRLRGAQQRAGIRPNRSCQSLQIDQLMEGLLSVRIIGRGRGSRFSSEQLVFVGLLEPGSATLQCAAGRCRPGWPLRLTVSSVASRSFDTQGLVTGLPSSRLARGRCDLERNHFLCEASDSEGNGWRVEGDH
ncbi:MAG: hypothetical protein VKJ66_07375 [Synechococcus sp.]|nr:hypothetical protein [Synechococcus sp.]